MRYTIYLLILLFCSCNKKTESNYTPKKNDKIKQIVPKTNLLKEKITKVNNPKIEISNDSVIYFSDSQFVNVELDLKEISKKIFQSYEKKYKSHCTLDSLGFIDRKGLILSHDCNDICETFLFDKKKKVKLLLPSNYDAGIIDLVFSPSCNQFIIYSSYDGPDYTEYYDYRAEIIGFTLTQEQGLDAIKPSFSYTTKDWSVDKITWIDDTTLGLKLYNNSKTGNLSNLKYSYFKTTLKPK